MSDTKLLSYGIVYKISNTINDLLYIGCSSRDINRRMSCHIVSAKTTNNKFYTEMRNLGILNFNIELIEEYQNITKKQLLEKEDYYIKLFNTVENGYNTKYSNYNNKCIHNKEKTTCRICKGNRICEHNKYKPNCSLCEGANLCIHEKIKNTCKECNSIKCEHCNIILGCKSTLKKHLKTCDKYELCEHKIRKNKCDECNYKYCECGKKFKNNYGLSRHKKESCGNKKIICKCKAEFKDETGLKRHLKNRCKLLV